MVQNLIEETAPVADQLHAAYAKMEKKRRDKKQVEGFDYGKEKAMLAKLKKPASVAAYHQALSDLATYYYKHRKLSDDFRNRCVFACIEDIRHLPALNQEEEYNNRLIVEEQYKSGLIDKPAYDRYINEANPWPGEIVAFRYLRMIFRENGDDPSLGLISGFLERYRSITGT